MAHVVLANAMAMACTAMANIVMANIVMADVAVTSITMAHAVFFYSYGLIRTTQSWPV